MQKTIAHIILWLSVINLGIAFGAGLFESRILLPQWLIFSTESGYQWNAEAVRQANTGLRFWVYVTTIPLTLLTLANLTAAWRSRGAVRHWWLGAVIAAVVERVLTFPYFIPTMIRLMGDKISQSDAVATALSWAHLNDLRHAAVLIAWLAALKAFSLIGKYGS